jgi:hypothetical protein
VPVYIADHAHRVKTPMAVASVIKTQDIPLFAQQSYTIRYFFLIATLQNGQRQKSFTK